MTSDSMHTAIIRLSTISLTTGLLYLSPLAGARAQTLQANFNDDGNRIQARVCNGGQCTSFGLVLPRITTSRSGSSDKAEGPAIHLNLD